MLSKMTLLHVQWLSDPVNDPVPYVILHLRVFSLIPWRRATIAVHGTKGDWTVSSGGDVVGIGPQVSANLSAKLDAVFEGKRNAAKAFHNSTSIKPELRYDPTHDAYLLQVHGLSFERLMSFAETLSAIPDLPRS